MNDPNRTGPHLPTTIDEAATPEYIGRYKVQRVLGQGGFGLVYLAHDEQLLRLVAIKVPHARLISCPENAEAYLAEGCAVANLDHPHIVPVYDVGSTEEFPCFVISKYIDGTDLATKLKNNRLPVAEAVAMTATVAEALHCAHKQGLVHRDIKPGNILLDKSRKPFVADFGLALREQDVGKGPRYAGTPGYMSPEQACGDGHRVDGRSDIFSLGVVFYELLTGRRPFHADSQEELLEQIANMEARPPRQWDDTIPKELERVCLKALSKRASERYTTAKDLADDLRDFLGSSAEEKSSISFIPIAGSLAAAPVLSPASTVVADQTTTKIMPKGSRPFRKSTTFVALAVAGGLLVMLAVPVAAVVALGGWQKYQEANARAKAVNNLKQLSIAITDYHEGGQLPSSPGEPAKPDGGGYPPGPPIYFPLPPFDPPLSPVEFPPVQNQPVIPTDRSVVTKPDGTSSTIIIGERDSKGNQQKQNGRIVPATSVNSLAAAVGCAARQVVANPSGW